jgi:hypothetical protein
MYAVFILMRKDRGGMGRREGGREGGRKEGQTKDHLR